MASRPYAASGLIGAASGDLSFQGIDADSRGTVGEGSRSTTINTADPMRQLLMNMILQQSSKTGAIPDYTLQALEKFTSNPSAAAEYFPDLARPLLSSLKPAEDQEVTQLNDMFRKAGGTSNAVMQSGAYAQAGRQLIGDQATRRQELLAKQYVPLTQQLSDNMSNNIKAGISVPGATAEAIKPLSTLAGSLSPLASTTETGVAKSVYGPGTTSSYIDSAQKQSAASAQQGQMAQMSQQLAQLLGQ